MSGLSRTREDKFAETLGDRESADEVRTYAKEIDRGFEDDEATVDFNNRWADVLKESEVEGMKDYIRKVRRRQPLPQDALSENEEYAMATVLLLKLGFHRVADFLKTCVTTPQDFEWDEIEQKLNEL